MDGAPENVRGTPRVYCKRRNKPASERPVNSGMVRAAGRGPLRRQEEIGLGWNTGACRQQTGKREKNRRNGRRSRIGQINLPFGEQTNSAEIRAGGIVVMEGLVPRTARRQQAEDEQQPGQQGRDEGIHAPAGRFPFVLHGPELSKSDASGKSFLAGWTWTNLSNPPPGHVSIWASRRAVFLPAFAIRFPLPMNLGVAAARQSAASFCLRKFAALCRVAATVQGANGRILRGILTPAPLSCVKARADSRPGRCGRSGEARPTRTAFAESNILSAAKILCLCPSLPNCNH